MTTVLDIINAAYREANIISGAQQANTAQITEALARLNTIVSSAYGFEVGGNQLVDWPIGVDASEQWDLIPSWDSYDWTCLEGNIRMVANSTIAQTVRLPDNPREGMRIALIDPQGVLPTAPLTITTATRTIQGVESLTINTSTPFIWFYRADLGDWVLLSTLVDTSLQFPFPPEFDDYFIVALTMRIVPRYGRSLPPESAAAMQRSLEQLRARYHQKEVMPANSGVLALTRGYGRWRTFGWPTKINRGRARWMV